MKLKTTYQIFDTDRIPAQEIAEKARDELLKLCVDIEVFNGKTGKNRLIVQGFIIRALENEFKRCCEAVVDNAINELKRGRKQLVTY